MNEEELEVEFLKLEARTKVITKQERERMLHRLDKIRNRIRYLKSMPDEEDGDYNYLERFLKQVAKEVGISEEYIELATKREIELQRAAPNSAVIEGATKRILNDAITIQTIYDTAEQVGISPEYLSLKNPLPYGEYLSLEKRETFKKILKGAFQLQEEEKRKKERERERKLERISRNFSFLSILSIAGLASGLFFLSYNMTGNVIGDISNPVSKIAGAGLFIAGLITTFFWAKR